MDTEKSPIFHWRSLLWVLIWGILSPGGLLLPNPGRTQDMPRLEKHGTATRLLVDGQPFIMLGGELHNSSASDLDYMAPVWNKLVTLNLNTVLATIAWEQVEPREGEYDFSLIDGLIERARLHNLRLVFLWFGSWKNGVSSYVPGWVKVATDRFPRALDEAGEPLDVLSPFSQAARDADARAFTAVLDHIRSEDEDQHTVLMIQVENEVGILGASRDYSARADSALHRPVPDRLITYLREHKTSLAPELYEIWQGTGFRTDGTWEDVFGSGPPADEIFMAWQYARYINTVATAGKKAYPLPMYVNAWLVQNDRQIPGDYPSGGPVARVHDIWKAGAPALDLLAPDIYLPDFKTVTRKYVRSDNPLMIPEARRGAVAARNVFWAIAQHNALCFAPFGIESIEMEHPLAESYRVLSDLRPLLTEYQGSGNMYGLLQQNGEPGPDINLGEYIAHVRFTGQDEDQAGYGLIIKLETNEFLLAGNYFAVSFTSKAKDNSRAGLLNVREGRFQNGRWIPGRWLNGDETAGGTRAQLPPNYGDQYADPGKPRIIRVRVYQY